jgi:hypothetical protein
MLFVTTPPEASRPEISRTHAVAPVGADAAGLPIEVGSRMNADAHHRPSLGKTLLEAEAACTTREAEVCQRKRPSCAAIQGIIYGG